MFQNSRSTECTASEANVKDKIVTLSTVPAIRQHVLWYREKSECGEPTVELLRISLGGNDMGNEIEKLQKIIDESRNIVFFGGAGVSTESGIRIFEARTDCITRNMITRRRRS